MACRSHGRSAWLVSVASPGLEWLAGGARGPLAPGHPENFRDLWDLQRQCQRQELLVLQSCLQSQGPLAHQDWKFVEGRVQERSWGWRLPQGLSLTKGPGALLPSESDVALAISKLGGEWGALKSWSHEAQRES